MVKRQITGLFAAGIRKALEAAPLDFEEVYEMRLRIHRPLLLAAGGKEHFLARRGGVTDRLEEAYLVSEEELRETLEYVAGYSLYAFEEELRQGFLTVQGGHRVGVAGSVVLDGGHVRTISPVTCLNVRLAHEKKGCADAVMPWIRDKRGIRHTLIVSPPRCGKTTLLRDAVRQISDGGRGFPGYTVGVVDERSELAGCYRGIPQNDVGLRTDVLDACPKAEGMMMLVRSMSPQVVAVDELGNYEDIHAIETVIHCGCRLLATMHGDSLEDIRKKPLMERLMKEQVFERYLVLKGGARAGEIAGIYDGRGEQIRGE
ncbi:MAG: stage III sporulation protein AA [Blautia sp.]